MKRNMDLIREILLLVEQKPAGQREIVIEPSHLPEQYNSISVYEIREHIDLAIERELIERVFQSRECCNVHRLTWKGHDFLDDARTPEIWNAAKASAGHLSFDIFRKVLNKLALDHGLSLLKSGFDSAVSAVT